MRLVINQIEDLISDNTNTTTRLIALAEDYCARRKLGCRHETALKQLAETCYYQLSEHENNMTREIVDRIHKLSLPNGDHQPLSNLFPSLDIIRIIDFLAQFNVDIDRMFQLISFYKHYYDSSLHPRYQAKVLLYLAQILLKILTNLDEAEKCRMSLETMYSLIHKSRPFTFD